MYNRYLRNDLGNYTRLPAPPHCEQPAASQPSDPPCVHIPAGDEKGKGLLSSLLKKLPLQEKNYADWMLLALLFFLFEEDADEELLIALGLLFIL